MAKNYKPTKNGYKEEDDDDSKKSTATTSTTPAKKKTPVNEDMDIPYPELGHTVSQLAQMEPPKRKSILGEKDAEFSKKYL